MTATYTCDSQVYMRIIKYKTDTCGTLKQQVIVLRGNCRYKMYVLHYLKNYLQCTKKDNKSCKD